MNKLKTSQIPTILSLEGNTISDVQRGIMNNATGATLRKYSIKKNNMWTYAAYEGSDLPASVVSDRDSAVKDVMMTFTGMISQTYLNKMLTFVIDDKEFNDVILSSDTRSYMENQISIITRRLIRNNPDTSVECRLLGDNYSFMMSASRRSADNELLLPTVLYDNRKCICKCSLDLRSLNKEMDLMRCGCSPIYMGRKDRDIANDIRSSNNIYRPDDRTIQLIYKSLQLLMNEKDNPSEKSDVIYTSTEMYFIKKILTELNREHGWPKDIQNWDNPLKESIRFESFYRASFLMSLDICKNSNTYPLLDLNDKEISFIQKYAASKKFLTEEEGKTFNLFSYLINTPYGNTFQYPVIHKDGTKEMILTSFILDEDTANLRMMIVENLLNHGMIVSSCVDLENIKEFYFSKSFTHINTSVIFQNIEIIPNSMSNVKALLPAEFMDSQNIFNIITDILAIHICIYDRPTRTRMINCTTKVPKTISQHKKKDADVECNFVITRILKTSHDAKEYVARMTENGYNDREYSLESWPRKGYYRRTKGGGSTWVPPTTCHRHLPLTEKELHIKL